MSTDSEREWRAFLVDLLKSKFQGAPAEAELVDQLKAMLTRRNVLALHAAASAKLINDPGGKYWPDQF